MGPTGRHVAPLNRNVIEYVRSTSFADGVSYTNIDWLQRSHRAEKRRQERGSHGRPHSTREASLEQYDDSCKVKPRIKKATERRIHRNKKQKAPRPARRRNSGEARERPPHMRPVNLREDPLQHFKRNTRNTQLRCNKSKHFAATKRSKFENRFSYSVSSILDAENLRASIERRMMNSPSSSPSGKRILSWSANSLH